MQNVDQEIRRLTTSKVSTAKIATIVKRPVAYVSRVRGEFQKERAEISRKVVQMHVSGHRNQDISQAVGVPIQSVACIVYNYRRRLNTGKLRVEDPRREDWIKSWFDDLED